jgi:hypothetical protein
MYLHHTVTSALSPSHNLGSQLRLRRPFRVAHCRASHRAARPGSKHARVCRKANRFGLSFSLAQAIAMGNMLGSRVSIASHGRVGERKEELL